MLFLGGGEVQVHARAIDYEEAMEVCDEIMDASELYYFHTKKHFINFFGAVRSAVSLANLIEVKKHFSFEPQMTKETLKKTSQIGW